MDDIALDRLRALVRELLETALADGSGSGDVVTFRVPRTLLSALAASLGDGSGAPTVIGLTELEARDLLAIIRDSACPFKNDPDLIRAWVGKRKRILVRLCELLADTAGPPGRCGEDPRNHDGP